MRPAGPVAVILSIVWSTFGAPSAAAVDLEQELRGLVASHPKVLAHRKQVEAANQGVRKAYSGYLPRVDVNAEYGPQQIDSPLTRDSGGGEYTDIRQVAGIRLNQRLFDGFATPADVRMARLNQEVAEFTLAGIRQNVLFDGAEAYIEVQRQSDLAELARTNEATIRTQLSLEDERVKRGAGIAVDVLQAKSRLQIAKERRVAFEGGLQDAIARYVRVFGHVPEVGALQPPRLPESELPESLEIALKIAENDNPAIDSSLATIDVASERRRLARSDYFPMVNVVATANREENADLVRGTRKEYALFLQATWNLFSGFKTTASVAQAAFDYRASQDNHEVVRREVLEQTRLAWNELETARLRVELLENAVAIASEVADARRKLREAGRETAINVLDADNELNNARINLTQAMADRAIAVFRVLQGIGRLDAPALALEE